MIILNLKKKEGRNMKKRIAALLLTAVLTMTVALPVSAVDMPPDGAPPDAPGGPGGGPAAAGQEFGTYEEVLSHAAFHVSGGTIQELPGDSDFSGEYSFDEGSKLLSPTGISGLNLTGNTLSGGIAVEMPSETDVFTIGGEATPYEVNGKKYNTVISVNAGEGNNDLGYEAVHGVGIGINTGELRLENAYIASEGPRSTPVYAFSTASPAATSVVAVNSTLSAHSDSIWMPPFKLLAGGARATLLMTRNNSWFYGSEILSNNWGAVSQDSVDAMTYMVNSSGVSTEGGYSTYLTYGMRLYGSDLYAGQYGVFMCGSSDILTDTGAAAIEDVDAMAKAPDFAVDTGRSSNVVAPFNAIVVHNSLPDISMVAKGVFRNTLVSTLPEHLPDSVTPMGYNDDFFMPGVDILGSGNGCGAAYFYNKNLYGSLALIRSMNADMTFDNAETCTSNNVLVHSVVTYDPPSASGYLTPEQSGSVPGIAATFINGAYTGDILHQDYQRAMTVTVGENATLTGKAVSGTYAAWNDLWSEEQLVAALEDDGYTPDFFENDLWVEDVQANLIRPEDTVYEGTDNTGISMTVAAGGTWLVTGDSSLSTLTIEDGGTLAAPEGCEFTLYTDCDSSNSLLFYDETVGTQVTQLLPGTYENVVIRVTGTPVVVDDTPAEEASLVDAPASDMVSEPPVEDTPAPGADVSEEAAPAQSGSSVSPLPFVIGGAVVLVIAVAVIILKKRSK